MTIFDLRRDKTLIKKVFENASKFIDIVSFQFTSEEIAKLLINKSNKGIKVRVITLPEDSYADVKERKKITDLYRELSNRGIAIPHPTSTTLLGL